MKAHHNTAHNHAKSSKILDYSNMSQSYDSITKININKKKSSPKLSIFDKKINENNQYLRLYPKYLDKIKNTILYAKPESPENYLSKEGQTKNTFISLHNPLRMSNNNKKNTNLIQRNSFKSIIFTNKFSGDINNFMQRRSSFQFDFIKKKDPKKNLKKIQRDLQMKLLDMSILINDDSDNNQEIVEEESFKRKLKKRHTEFSIKQKQSSKSFKSIKEVENKPTNKNLLILPTKSINDSKVDSSRNENGENRNSVRSRRQSFVPKSDLMNKFEKHHINYNQQNNQKTNISVNADLYRDLFPNLNLDVSEKEINNISNKSMFISKKQVNIKKILLNSLKNEQFENKYRLLMRNKELYDSYEDEEVIVELEDEKYVISPETYYILIFDILILLCTLFGSLYLPIYMSQSKCFCSYMPKTIEYILFFYEFINIIDIILCFFRGYYNFEFALIKKKSKIIKHYLGKFFFLDLICAIPFFTISYYFCNIYKYKPDGNICLYNGVDGKYNFIKMCLGLKLIKLFKVMDKKDNRGINYFYEFISENYTIEKIMKMVVFTIMCVIGFNFFICYHIYIGIQSYPNWLLKTNIQDSSFITKYVTSFYFLIATITSVGYGDITCISISETFYQIIILTIGVVAYSWIVSTIGNYVKKESRAAIKFNKDVSLLEEIRISYPNISFKLYNKIYKHLETVSHQQEKLDSNLLLTNLPYTLKNQIMFVIYSSIINKFIFFKDCENSDFILRVLTSFIPLSTKKGAFIIQEGEIIDNIVFVKEGRLSLVATIDLDNPFVSISNYLGEKFEDINEKMNTKFDNSYDDRANTTINKEHASTVLKTVLKTKEDIAEENIEQEMAKKDFNDEVEIGNLQFLNILDILRNEHYGVIYMFLKKPSPLSLRVKSKYCQLFFLRKNDSIQISKAYPNVWKKIYYKSYHNMKSIKKMTKKIVMNYCRSYGYKYNYEANNEDSVITKQDNEFFFEIGLVNSRKRKNSKQIAFNLDGAPSSNKNLITTPKSILKHNIENNNENLHVTINKKGIGKYKSVKSGNHSFKKKYLGALSSKNIIAKHRRERSNSHINIKPITLLNHRFSSLINNEYVHGNRMNNINHYSNNINYNIVINDIDINNDSKTLLNSEEIKKSLINKQEIKTIKTYNSLSSFNKARVKQSNFMENIPSKIKKASNFIDSKNNISKCGSEYNNNINSNSNTNLNKEEYHKVVTLQMKNSNTNFSRNNTVEIKEPKENESEESPNTIHDLSKSLLKKIKKKIKKRQKRKKLYKMFLHKITDALNKINPNINLSSSLNSNSIIISSKVGDIISPELHEIIEEKPEFNSQFSQSINPIIHPNLNNNIITPPPLIPKYETQQIFLIPDSLELSSSSSEISSEDSKETNNSKNKEKEDENENMIVSRKVNEITSKKEIELSISQNTSFTLNTTYENLNNLSEGNYSKDESLRNSVLKVIQTYLIDKKKFESEKKQSSLVLRRSSITKSPKINNSVKEKDVWSFLDVDNNKANSNISKTKDSIEKANSNLPGLRQKKTNNMAKRKKYRSVYENLFSLEELPKTKKLHKKKKTKSINKTIVKKDLNKSRPKKRITNTGNIINLKELGNLSESEENKEQKNDQENNKEKEKDKDKETINSSLEFSDLDEENKKVDNIMNKYYKNYKKKNNEKSVDNLKVNHKDLNN